MAADVAGNPRAAGVERERNIDNVRKAVASLGVDHPVAIDNNDAIWRGSNNEYWPAYYFIDAQGRIRHHHFGEGDYAGSERVIQQLLAEAGRTTAASGIVAVNAIGTEAAPDDRDVGSPETYIGSARAENFVSSEVGGPNGHAYKVGALGLNDWGLSGGWTIDPEYATLDGRDGAIVYRFHARDLHLVLGPGRSTTQPIRFQSPSTAPPPARTTVRTWMPTDKAR